MVSPGEQRRRQAKRERDRAAYSAALAALPVGARCETCAHCGKYPDGGSKRTCILDSDFDGYAIVQPTDVCPRWAAISP